MERSDGLRIAIVEIGPDGIDEDQAARLKDLLRAIPMEMHLDLEVIFELSPDLPFNEVLEALDTGIGGVRFSDTTTNGRPPPGVRVNGVDLDDLDELPPVPKDHPALDRSILIRRE